MYQFIFTLWSPHDADLARKAAKRLGLSISGQNCSCLTIDAATPEVQVDFLREYYRLRGDPMPAKKPQPEPEFEYA